MADSGFELIQDSDICVLSHCYPRMKQGRGCPLACQRGGRRPWPSARAHCAVVCGLRLGLLGAPVWSATSLRLFSSFLSLRRFLREGSRVSRDSFLPAQSSTTALRKFAPWNQCTDQTRVSQSKCCTFHKLNHIPQVWTIGIQ